MVNPLVRAQPGTRVEKWKQPNAHGMAKKDSVRQTDAAVLLVPEKFPKNNFLRHSVNLT